MRLAVLALLIAGCHPTLAFNVGVADREVTEWRRTVTDQVNRNSSAIETLEGRVHSLEQEGPSCRR